MERRSKMKMKKIGSYRIIVVNSGTISVNFCFILRRSTGEVNSDGLKRRAYHLVNRKAGIYMPLVKGDSTMNTGRGFAKQKTLGCYRWQ